MRFETKAIHAGQASDPRTGAVNVPVYQTSTYEQDGIGLHRGYEYSRTGNPTRTALEEALASLEEAAYGLAFASGVAATSAVINLLKAGDHIISVDDIYGGTYRLFEKVFGKWGLETSYVDADDPDGFRKAVRSNTRLIWLETPTNPLLKIVDIREAVAVAKENNIILAVDNTFATPYFQQPLTRGADIVVHSTTKYLSGHSDIIGGAVLTSNESIYNELKFHQNAAGAVPGPWDCFLALRGLKTLSVRMREHEKNAIVLAEYLSKHPKIERIYYPGLRDNKYHTTAKKQMSGFGAMISIELKGDLSAVEKFLKNLKLFILAESLGGVESLVCYPPKMTHGSYTREERAARGIRDNLLRLSVGIENIEDLKEDIEQALER